MLSRRDLIFSGALTSSFRPAEPMAAQRSSQSSISTEDELKALTEIRDALRQLPRVTLSSELAEIRDKQRSHFKFNQKFPDYIDIGIQVWERLYLWGLEHPNALTVSRTTDGRLVMQFMFTTLLLRADVAETHIGNPYDR